MMKKDKKNIIIIDDFLSSDEIILCKKEISEIKDIKRDEKYLNSNGVVSENNGIIDNEHKFASYDRIYIDNYYKDFRDISYILNLISKKLFSDKIYQKSFKINDSSFILLRKSTKHETQVTSYGNNDGYNWHIDNDDSDKIESWNGRILNYIIYLNDKGFSGGNLEIINEYPSDGDVLCSKYKKDHKADYIIKPKNGRLVIMPSYLIHRVTKINNSNSDFMNRRLTINGHVGFNTF